MPGVDFGPRQRRPWDHLVDLVARDDVAHHNTRPMGQPRLGEDVVWTERETVVESWQKYDDRGSDRPSQANDIRQDPSDPRDADEIGGHPRCTQLSSARCVTPPRQQILHVGRRPGVIARVGGHRGGGAALVTSMREANQTVRCVAPNRTTVLDGAFVVPGLRTMILSHPSHYDP